MELAPTEKRFCPRCKAEKILGEAFYRSKSKGSKGWAGYCKLCTKEAAVAWQKKNPEKKKAADHKQYATKPERRRRVRERLAQWALENPEKARECARAGYKRYAAKHPDRIRRTQERYRKSEKGKALHRRWRASRKYKDYHRDYMREARKLATYKVREMLRTGRRVHGARPRPPIVPLVSGWIALVEAHGGRCVFCGTPGNVVSLEIEHLTPKVRGGEDATGNLAPACKRCNSSKHDKTVEEFASYARRIGSTRWHFDPAAIRRVSEEVARASLTGVPNGG